jgi:hypothetical protein
MASSPFSDSSDSSDQTVFPSVREAFQAWSGMFIHHTAQFTRMMLPLIINQKFPNLNLPALSVARGLRLHINLVFFIYFEIIHYMIQLRSRNIMIVGDVTKRQS